MNRRKYPRFHVELRCSFSGTQCAGEGTVLDLSMEGCCIRSDAPVVKGDYLEMSVNLLGQIAPLPVELAVIRWSAGRVFGLEFIRMAGGQQTRLRHYVQDLEEAMISLVPTTSMGGPR